MIFVIFPSTGEEIGIDATLSITRQSSQETTDHPIEDGSSISDHVIIQPRILSINGFMSDVPIQPSGPFQFTGLGSDFGAFASAAFRGALSLLSTVTGQFEPYKFDADGYHQYAHDRFEQACNDGETVEVRSVQRGHWSDLIITSYSANWATETGSGLPFTMELKQIVKASSKTSLLTAALNVASALTGSFESKDIARQFNPLSDSGLAATATAPTKQSDRLTEINAVGSLSSANDFFRGA